MKKKVKVVKNLIDIPCLKRFRIEVQKKRNQVGKDHEIRLRKTTKNQSGD